MKTKLTAAELKAYQDLADAARRLRIAQKRADARRRRNDHQPSNQPQHIGEIHPQDMADIAQRRDNGEHPQREGHQ